jgi:SAM-dependent methyltransferase
MNVDDAAALIAPAVRPAASPADPLARWADLGAGQGTFTRALARLLGPAGQVLAVDRDPAAAAALARLADGPGRAAGAAVGARRADFADPAALDAALGALGWPALGGALLANALHFVPAEAQAAVLGDVAARLAPGGRLVVVEYEGRRPSRWVPAPVSFARLGALAARLGGVGAPAWVGERPSAFGGAMYAAVVERRP